MSTDERRPGAAGLCGVRAAEHAPGSRLYPCGYRCALHTPNAMSGRPEPPPGPGWPVHRQPPPEPESDPAAPTGTEHEQDTP
ncbi:hypothetical protein [Streptomyces sp. NPDC056160]|uniref:hypothetical protein n=1 Tax=Streptomyces sp. NPDC056160 TaxID=3345731 RepID=UPI0035D9668F